MKLVELHVLIWKKNGQDIHVNFNFKRQEAEFVEHNLIFVQKPNENNQPKT